MYHKASPIDEEIRAIRTRGRSLGRISPYADVLRRMPASVLEARDRIVRADRERAEESD
jgi:hypothetical protein